MDKKKHIFNNNICLSEWGETDVETILRDLVLYQDQKLKAFSIEIGSYTIAKSMSINTKIQIFAFTNNLIQAQSLANNNAKIQFFIHDVNKMPDIHGIIPSFALNEIEHLDFGKIILYGHDIKAPGFMFIDDNLKYLHRFYDFLNIVDDSFDNEIQYCVGTNDTEKINMVYRLVEKTRPDLLPNLRLFVTNEFDFSGQSV
jgi:hypothetical protein